MRWAEHEASVRETIHVNGDLVGKPEAKRPLGILDVDGRIILIWIFKKYD
jgi:hypothetical protein